MNDDHEPARQLFCFGLGYTGSWLARDLIALGWRVFGTVRNPEKKAGLSAIGVNVLMFERGRPVPELSAILQESTHLLCSVPPDEIGDPVLDEHEAEIAQASARLWTGYLSTTGVYGNRDGGWVDETSELKPTGERGHRRKVAEERWLSLPRPAHIFRLAGIYGPGSSALDSVREGRAKRIIKPGQVFSRIHVADIARSVLASMLKPNPGRIYNLCDDDPAPPSEVIEFACDLLGRPKPLEIPFEKAELSPMARSFYADNKRVRNERIKQELGITLKYPSYRAGLREILASGF